MTGRSRDSAYWRSRIEREHADIARRLQAGEIRSVRAAAIEAGLICDPSPLNELRRAWRKADAEARTAFLAEIAMASAAGPAAAAASGAKPRRRQSRLAKVENDLFAFQPSLQMAPSQAPPRQSPSAPVSDPGPILLPGAQSTPPALPPRPERPGTPVPRPPARPTAISGPPEPATPIPAAPVGAPAFSNGSGGKALSRMRRLFGLGKDADGGGAHLGKGGTVDDHGIVVGQRYIKIDAGPGAWEVLSVFAGPRNMPHARIASLEEPDVVRVVSLAALGDRSRYQPVA